MTRSKRPPIRRRGLILGCAVLLAAAGTWLALLGRGTPSAAGLAGAPELVAQTDDSPPVGRITLFGAAPEERAGEVWGLAPTAQGGRPVTYSPSSGWTLEEPLQNSAGEPLTGFALDTPENFRETSPSPLAASITADGAAAMLGTIGSAATLKQIVLVRDPGGAFKEAPLPAGEEGLHPGEQLFGLNSAPLVAALQEGEGKAGAFVVPHTGGVEGAVLHWDGSSWHRETIEAPPSASEFEVLAIGAGSPQNAWLLARSGGAEGPLSLYRRQSGANPPVWAPVATRAGGEAGAPIEVAGETLDEPHPDQAQLLTVTSSAVWLDARLHASRAPASLYFSPEGETKGSFTGLWCQIPASSPGATAEAANECQAHPLPELPTDYSLSFAWPGPGYGERIVTGGFDGRFLRLTGVQMEKVNSLGSQQTSDPGATFGAAFSSGSDGWLGNTLIPVHITTAEAAAPTRLSPRPVPFRYALTALAPKPGAALGAENSEAMAVGDNGEVARYQPGKGWLPESLLGAGARRQAPRLRAVAWPTPNRIFAVGDSMQGSGEMWLWRGETGLWERDPAMPVNFRGNLLGIAFDPANSGRGYAVGQQGVLLRYGKSWVQEEEQNIPPAARGANFTSIAFAGSEAIVAWRKLVKQGQNLYTGGVIANSGSGWHEDEGASAMLGTGAVPWAVAGLPDGGAAFTAKSPSQGATIYERSGPGQSWQGIAYPGGLAPGALTLFREGGALRAIGTSAEPSTFPAEEESTPPPGAPPILVNPYPLPSSLIRGVLRQTPSGWSDEQHELNEARETPGDYRFWDTPKVPDPVNAVLVDPTGSEGWAVGGIVSSQDPVHLDTSDIYRYPSAGGPPTEEAPVATAPGFTSVAIGGGAACSAPCASRTDPGIGPQVWMRRAITQAEDIVGAGAPGEHSVGAFVYTGPGVSAGELAGPRLFPVPWGEEEADYAQRLSPGDPSRFAVCAAASPSDREGSGEGSPASFDAAFTAVPNCRTAGEPAGDSYAFERCPPADGAFGTCSTAEGLRVIVIDTSVVQAGERQLAPNVLGFLHKQLQEAEKHAIVVGNADLPREYSEGRSAARQLVAAIEEGNAAAYFFDSPEQDVQETLTGASCGTKAYGSGTLGYVNVGKESSSGGFIGQSGFLLAEVSSDKQEVCAATKATQPRYEQHVRLVPNVEELAVEGEQGTLLQRSHVASFAGLARRPRAGNRAFHQASEYEVSPYVPIPDICKGARCTQGIVPEYTFESSDPHYGQFVKRNLNSSNPKAVAYDAHGKPISEEAEGGKGGLFCAYNATPPGQPVYVILKTGNLEYKLPVTIQGGSVAQPCGTVPLAAKPTAVEPAVTPPPAQEPPPAGSSPPPSINVPFAVPAPAPVVSAPPPHAPVTQFLPQAAPVAFIPAFVPVPLPTPARPTPPSGTSAVTSPVEAAQKEEEEEAAPESVDASAAAYHPSEHEIPPAYLVGLAVLAAFAGASLRGRRRPRRGTRIAPATVNASRNQRRYEREMERRRR